NGETSECKSPVPSELKRKKNVTGQEVVEVEFNNQKIRFLPAMSPLPLNDKMELSQDSPYRIFSKKLFEKSPHLFLFGKSVAFFHKDTKKWESKPLEVNGEVELPWMGFKVK